MTSDCSTGLPRKVGFLLLPGFSMLAFFSALEPLRLSNQLLGYRHHNWLIYTPDGAPVRASCGMIMSANAEAKASKDGPSCLIVISGFDPWPQPDPRLKNWLRALDRRGVLLGAVDTAAFLLASAGLLKTVRTVVHWESADALREMFPELTLSDKPYEIQGRRFLCAGGAATLEMMIALLERTHGAALAENVASRLMLVCAGTGNLPIRPPSASRTPMSDPDVTRATEVMQASVETVVSVSEIASTVGVSKRTLERKFRQVLKRTPSQVYLQLRLEHAQRLLRNTDLQIREVSLASGFSSMSYFCRSYKKLFRRRPGCDRRLDYSLVDAGTAPTSAMGVTLTPEAGLLERD